MCDAGSDLFSKRDRGSSQKMHVNTGSEVWRDAGIAEKLDCKPGKGSLFKSVCKIFSRP